MFKGLVERRRVTNPLNLLVYRDRPVMVAINPTSIHILAESNKVHVILIKYLLRLRFILLVIGGVASFGHVT